MNTRVTINMIFHLTKLLHFIGYFFLKKKILFVYILWLSACVGTVDPSLPKAVSLLSGDKKIIISSPKGFCVDQRLANKV